MERKGMRSYGLFTTIVLTMCGIYLFDYPRYVCTDVGRNGWIIPIVSSIAIAAIMMIIYYVEKVNNFAPFNDIVIMSFGKIFGYIIMIGFSIYYIVILSINMKTFAEVINIYLLPNTPAWFLIGTVIIVGIYVMSFGFEEVMKFNEIMFFIIFIPMIVALLLLISSMDLSNLMPFESIEIYGYLKGAYDSLPAFGGFEILFLACFYTGDKNKIKKSMLYAVGFVAIFYMIIVIFSISSFSIVENKILLWNGITMISSIDIPGNFIERWEGIVMVMWIFFYFTTFITIEYFLCYLLNDIFSCKRSYYAPTIASLTIFILSLILTVNSKATDFLKWIMKPFELVMLIGVPFLIFIANIIRHRFRRKKDEV